MKVAIIGRGFGAYAMKPAFESRGWQVDLVPSRDGEAVAAACAGDADLIAVHSPPFQHLEHVMAALAAGKPVLCDKPFGRSGDEARAMRDAARAAGVLHFLNFEFRCQPAMLKTRELLDAGAIGTLLHVATQAHASFVNARPHGWLHDADKGGGWIGAWGSHMIDAIRGLSGSDYAECRAVRRIDVANAPGSDGEPVAVTAEDAFVATFTMASGVTASLDAAFGLPVALPVRTRLLGSGGVIELVNNAHVTLHRKGEEPQVFDYTPDPKDRVWPALAGWIERIEGALATGEQIAPNFDDGVVVAEVMDRLRA